MEEGSRDETGDVAGDQVMKNTQKVWFLSAGDELFEGFEQRVVGLFHPKLTLAILWRMNVGKCGKIRKGEIKYEFTLTGQAIKVQIMKIQQRKRQDKFKMQKGI